MKKLYLAVMIILSCETLQSQNTFIKEYAYPGKTSGGRYILENSNNSFTVSTTFSDLPPLSPNDIGLINCNDQGIINWSRAYTNGGNNDLYSFISLQQHGYLITGRRTTAPASTYILFLDTAGNIVRLLHPSNYYNILPAYSAYDSSVYLFGSHNLLSLINVTKLDINGNLIWSKVYSDIGTGGASINVTPDNGLMMSYLKTGSNFHNGYVHQCMVKTDAAGNVQWSKVWAPADTTYGLGTHSVEIFNQEKYIYNMSLWTGLSNSWLVTIDTSGQILNNGLFYALSGQYQPLIVRNYEIDLIRDHGTHFFDFIRLDPLLMPIYAYQYNDSSYYNDILDMAVTPAYELIITGNESAGGGTYNTLVIKTNSNASTGCFENPLLVTSTALPIIDSVWTVTDSVVTFTSVDDSNFFNPVTITPSVINSSCIPSGLNNADDVFNEIVTAPNPFHDIFSITIQNSEMKQLEFLVYNIYGQMVFHQNDSNSSGYYKKTIDLTGFPGGIYILNTIIEGKHHEFKIVKE